MARLSDRFRSDLAFRGIASVYSGMGINLIYALFKGVAGWALHSWWMGAEAVYYLILCGIRLELIRSIRLSDALEGSAGDRQEWSGCRNCGIAMFTLNIGMTGLVVQMVRGHSITYPGVVIYAAAFYAFYSLVMSIIGLVRFRKVRPLLACSKLVSVAVALMSVLGLQTALISRFGTDVSLFQQTMNTATGTAVCVLTLLLAGGIILASCRKLRALR